MTTWRMTMGSRVGEQDAVLRLVSIAITGDAAVGSRRLELFFGVCLKGVAFGEACVSPPLRGACVRRAISGWTSRSVVGKGSLTVMRTSFPESCPAGNMPAVRSLARHVERDHAHHAWGA